MINSEIMQCAPGWVGWLVGGWMDGWMGAKAVLRIAYSNQEKKKKKEKMYKEKSL